MDSNSKQSVRAAAQRGGVFRRGLTAVLVVVSFTMAAGANGAQRPAKDQFSIARAAVEQHFTSLPDYQPGDLVTRSQVLEALEKVSDAGAKVPDAARIVELTLPDSSFLARELSTPAGRKFMRKVGRNPDGFSRLDRLSSISRGQSTVRDLIRNPNGDKFIEYLATTRGGRKLGSTLGGAQGGTDINKPTGRIYTAEDLLSELQRSFAAQSSARGGKQ
jgi:hypothetical protein